MLLYKLTRFLAVVSFLVNLINDALENPELFSSDYNVNSIPRFILIDSEGKIYNSNMPRPSDSAFEIIIRKALGLKELE